jgi:hypothetical protein
MEKAALATQANGVNRFWNRFSTTVSDLLVRDV